MLEKADSGCLARTGKGGRGAPEPGRPAGGRSKGPWGALRAPSLEAAHDPPGALARGHSDAAAYPDPLTQTGGSECRGAHVGGSQKPTALGWWEARGGHLQPRTKARGAKV